MFALGRPFQPSLMFAGVDRSLPWRGASDKEKEKKYFNPTFVAKRRQKKVRVHLVKLFVSPSAIGVQCYKTFLKAGGQ